MRSAGTAFFFLVAASYGQNLSAVLARMDAAAVGFRSIAADMTRLTFTAVINDSSEESGTMRLLRAKPGDVRVRIDLIRPDSKTVAFSGRKAEIYNPKIQTVEEYDLGKHRNLIDQFLLLGFGTTGKEISHAYTLRYTGEEAVAGVNSSHLELTPQSTEVSQHFNRIELWIADPEGYAVRQKLHAPSGNHTTITYTAVKLNGDMNPDQLALKLPRNVKRIFPGK